MTYEWKGGGQSKVVDKPRPTPKTVYRITWGLEVFGLASDLPEDDHTIRVLNSPDVDCFRMTFATAEDAAFTAGEIQRFLGRLLFRLSDDVQLPKALAELRVLFGDKPAQPAAQTEPINQTTEHSDLP